MEYVFFALMALALMTTIRNLQNRERLQAVDLTAGLYVYFISTKLQPEGYLVVHRKLLLNVQNEWGQRTFIGPL